MKNILGHCRDLSLYDANGMLVYDYENNGKEISETYYDENGNVESEMTVGFDPF